MACRHSSVALIFALALATLPAFAAENEAEPAAAPPASTAKLEEMTPAQLRALQARLARQNAATREANAAAIRRIEELERRNAELDAKRAQVEAELAALQEQMEALEAARGD